MKSRAERFVIPALAFVLPGVVMLWVYAALGVAPFGDRTVLLSDMSSQYVEFFCALKNGEVFFSWSKALGTGYIGVFSYYVSSPLSLLTLLAPNEELPAALAVLTALKIALAGLSFCLFIRRRYPLGDGAAVFASVCYALMSYNAVYAICIMWLDGVIWLPLILLALERILAGRGAGPFVVALALCFVSTWYISYMIGIFCALYLCARLYVLRPKGRELGRIAARFFGGAACALGLTAWLWLPTFLSMFNGKFSGGNVDYPGLLACTPLDILSQLRPGQYRSIASGSAVYLFCGSAALVLAGGMGNLIDRVVFGFVTDMFQTTFMEFAVFNVADCCITVGVPLLFLYVWFYVGKDGKKDAEAPQENGAENRAEHETDGEPQ